MEKGSSIQQMEETKGDLNTQITASMSQMFREIVHVNPLSEKEIKTIAKECTEKKWYNATLENIDRQPMARLLLSMIFDKYQYMPDDLEILLSQGCGIGFPNAKIILRSDFIKISDLYNKSKEVFE